MKYERECKKVRGYKLRVKDKSRSRDRMLLLFLGDIFLDTGKKWWYSITCDIVMKTT